MTKYEELVSWVFFSNINGSSLLLSSRRGWTWTNLNFNVSHTMGSDVVKNGVFLHSDVGALAILEKDNNIGQKNSDKRLKNHLVSNLGVGSEPPLLVSHFLKKHTLSFWYVKIIVR